MTKLKWWETTLIIIGSPVWLSLLISLAAAAVSVYVSLWAIVISLWAVFVSFIAFGLYGIASGMAFACAGNISGGAALPTPEQLGQAEKELRIEKASL